MDGNELRRGRSKEKDVHKKRKDKVWREKTRMNSNKREEVERKQQNWE